MNAQPDKPEPDRPARTCPICRAPTNKKFAPFCSSRCADIDLGRWMKGRYVIEGSDSLSSEGDDEDTLPPDQLEE